MVFLTIGEINMVFL